MAWHVIDYGLYHLWGCTLFNCLDVHDTSSLSSKYINCGHENPAKSAEKREIYLTLLLPLELFFQIFRGPKPRLQIQRTHLPIPNKLTRSRKPSKLTRSNRQFMVNKAIRGLRSKLLNDHITWKKSLQHGPSRFNQLSLPRKVTGV